MFEPEAMIFVVFLIGLTAFGTYYTVRQKYLHLGMEIGTDLTIDSLVQDGFMRAYTDKDGDLVLVSIENVEKEAIEKNK